MDRVIFIPFPPPYAHEFMERTNNWVQERPEKNFRIIVYNPQRAALGLGRSPLLMNLMNGSSIYLRGHGLPGDPHVTTSLNGAVVKITIQDSIDRLMEMGLRNDFRGTLKFYSCYSGLDQPKKWVSGTGTLVFTDDVHKTKVKNGTFTAATKSLASVGASYFRSLKFKHCKYVGYLGPLTGKYEPSDSSPDGRNYKWCEVTTFDTLGDRYKVDPTMKVTRASEAQKFF
ncbi:MAG TPA: hypothetical protein VMU82_15905 [Acetobacteraceae bacterium]|nr:hypothetical protein [Acetobacteraceae bacterium]